MRARSILLSACGMVAGAVLWVGLATSLRAGPTPTDTASRLGIAAASLLPALVVLSAMILAQIGVRFMTGRFDPTNGQDGRFLVVNQRVITNTVEQLAVFAPSLLALAARASNGAAMAPLIAAGLTFAVARAVFWAGYLAHPMLRAPGMAATGGTSIATLGAACWVWLAA